MATCTKLGCDRAATHTAEVNAPGRGHGYDHYCEEHAEAKRGQTYVREVTEGVHRGTAADGGERPDDCECGGDDLPCAECYISGFDNPNPNAGED